MKDCRKLLTEENQKKIRDTIEEELDMAFKNGVSWFSIETSEKRDCDVERYKDTEVLATMRWKKLTIEMTYAEYDEEHVVLRHESE